MLTCSLQSGSNGNCVYVEAGGVSLLFDAGISGRQAELRLAARGRHPKDADALIVSHDHIDHVRCAGIYQRKFGLPIYVTRATWRAVPCPLGPVSDVRYFKSGRRLRLGEVIVHTIRTPHDAADSVAFVVEHGRKRLGILTDLGHPFSGLAKLLATLDAAYLESNYDAVMLARGPYPPRLKDRIRGARGHLSNVESASLVAKVGNGRLRWVALAHLSEQNNNPEIALATYSRTVGRSVPLHVASRYEATPLLEV